MVLMIPRLRPLMASIHAFWTRMQMSCTIKRVRQALFGVDTDCKHQSCRPSERDGGDICATVHIIDNAGPSPRSKPQRHKQGKRKLLKQRNLVFKDAHEGQLSRKTFEPMRRSKSGRKRKTKIIKRKRKTNATVIT